VGGSSDSGRVGCVDPNLPTSALARVLRSEISAAE
jgi:hypothetical protein